MKVKLKTLQRKEHLVDVDPEDTVLDVKRKFGAEQGVEDYEGYRLIFKGKVLKDPVTVKAAGISEDVFLVVMPPKKVFKKDKPKAEGAGAEKDAAPKAEGAKTDSAPDKGDGEKPKAEEKRDEAGGSSAGAATPAGTATASGSGAPATGALLTGPEYDAAVARITEMGFPVDTVKAAMRAAFNNPDRAVEYLFSGIPDMPADAGGGIPGGQTTGSAPGAAPAAGNQANPSGQNTESNADDTEDGPGTTPFNMFAPPPQNQRATGGGGDGAGLLQNEGNMNAFRRLIQSNPELAAGLLGQLEQQDPGLLQSLGSNPEALVQALNRSMPPGTQGGAGGDVPAWAQNLFGNGGAGGGGSGGRVIRVNEEEREALTRLEELGQAMGVNKQSVLQTWLACDRNENLTANYIADHTQELRETQDDFEGGGQNNGGSQGEGGDSNQGQNQNPPQ